MPPIPVHIDDPITPQKASGVTPQTTDSPEGRIAPPPSTTVDQSTSTYPVARPGAAPALVPVPTPYIPSPAPAPSRTTTGSYDGPPPPQPGAVPVASARGPPSTATSTIPPPPKAGETAQRPAAATTTTMMPPQTSIPPPAQNYAPTHSTATAPVYGGPTTLNLGPVSVQPAEPPAGYHQDLYAQEMSSAQRASLDEQERREHGQGVGANLGLHAGDNANETVNNVWNAVKGWANTAGQKLAETEEEVWKKINSRS